MKTTRVFLAAVIGVGLACGVAAQVTQQPGEMVQMKSLPASVQQTISQKTAGGEIVRVKREDDANGKWNYEVVVRTNGQEWGFEVDPNGKLLKQHSAIKRVITCFLGEALRVYPGLAENHDQRLRVGRLDRDSTREKINIIHSPAAPYA